MVTKESVLRDLRILGAKEPNHIAREGFGMDVLKAATGEDAQFVRCEKGTITTWFPQEAARMGLTEPAQPERKARNVAEWKAKKAGIALTADPVPEKTPFHLACDEHRARTGSLTFTDWKRLKASFSPDGRGAA